MAIDHLKNVKISAVACAVPNDKLTAEDFYKYLEKDVVDRFVKDVGVSQKFYSKNRRTITSDLCYEAAEEIFRKKNIDKESIDGLIFISQTPDYPAPATACLLQYRLGLSENCMAYDVSLGCSGYIYGLHMAATSLQSGYMKKILLLVGDTSDGTSPTVSLNDLLFGDCGSATIVEYDEMSDGFKFDLRTIGNGFKALGATTGLRYAHIGNPSFDPSIHMDGLSIFTFSISQVPKLFKSFLQSFNKTIEDYDTVLLHQANKSMLDVIIKKIKADINKVPFSLNEYANTSSATIPNLICHYYGESNIDTDISAIMAGFGIGLSLGIADAKINPINILPIISTDTSWDEGRQKVIEANDKLKK